MLSNIPRMKKINKKNLSQHFKRAPPRVAAYLCACVCATFYTIYG